MILYIKYCTGKIGVKEVTSISISEPQEDGSRLVEAWSCEDEDDAVTHAVAPGGSIRVSDHGSITVNMDVTNEKMREVARLRLLLDRLDTMEVNNLAAILGGAPHGDPMPPLVANILAGMKKHGLTMEDVL